MTPSWIVTQTGKRMDLANPTMEMVNILDIAHGLSNVCRFAGHTHAFYSVARHSLLVARHTPGSARRRLLALLHDASEAYLGDVTTPLKALLSPRYQELQQDMTQVIYAALGIGSPSSEDRDAIKSADLVALVYEAEGQLGIPTHELDEQGFPGEYSGLWDPWDPHAFAQNHYNEPPMYVAGEFLSMYEKLGREIENETAE